LTGTTNTTLALTVFHRMRLSGRERRGLIWMKSWARARLTAAKRKLKYLPRKTVFDDDEREILMALVDLERAAGRLLDGEDKEI